MLGGVALTTVIGFLLAPHKDSTGKKKTAKKNNGRLDEERKTQKTVSGVRNQIKEMDKDIDRMIDEGG